MIWNNRNLFSHFWRLEGWNESVGRPAFLSESLGENPCLASSRLMVTIGIPWLLATSLSMLSSHCLSSVCPVFLCLPLIRIQVIEFRDQLNNLDTPPFRTLNSNTLPYEGIFTLLPCKVIFTDSYVNLFWGRSRFLLLSATDGNQERSSLSLAGF